MFSKRFFEKIFSKISISKEEGKYIFGGYMSHKYFAESEEKQRSFIDPNGCLVIRLDGKSVTKNRKKYDLTDMSDSGFREALIQSAYRASKNYLKNEQSIFMYTALDEISVVFPDAKIFLDCFDDGNTLYCGGVFLQQFLSVLWKNACTETFFGISVFSLPYKDGINYIKDRKDYLYTSSLIYLAKGLGLQKLYHGRYGPLNKKEILRRVSENKLITDEIKKNKRFISGDIVVCNKNICVLAEKDTYGGLLI